MSRSVIALPPLVAAATTEPGSPYFALGGALWLIPYLGLCWWRYRTQLVFVQLYRARYPVQLSLPEEDDYAPSPKYAWRLLRLLHDPVTDPIVESARRRVLRIHRLAITYGCVGIMFPFLFSFL